jgi:hypothetical protein
MYGSIGRSHLLYNPSLLSIISLIYRLHSKDWKAHAYKKKEESMKR